MPPIEHGGVTHYHGVAERLTYAQTSADSFGG